MIENKIAITKIVNDNVKLAIYSALELINAKRIFKPNMKILLKPNLLKPKEPKRAVTTHPEVLRAVVQWIKQFNPERIVVADSSCTKTQGITDKACKVSGIKAVCDEENIEWTPFEKTPRKVYQVKNPLVLKEFPSSTLLEEVDLIINIPKIKTHDQCLLTCSIKNMFGTLILGMKVKTHAMFPYTMNFSAALADIYSVSKPHLTVIDGYYCQEGNGPSAGDIVKMDLILAGFDPVALDTTVCNIINFDPNEVYHIAKAEQKGLGTSDIQNVEILGETINSVKREFKKPKHFDQSLLIPNKYTEYVGKTIFRSSIKFNKSRCKLCSTCWENCPAKAISPPKHLKKGKKIPKWDKSKCFTCYCCAELCPHDAVEFKMNFLWLLYKLFRLLFRKFFRINVL